MRRPLRFLPGSLAALLLILSCVDGDSPVALPAGPVARLPIAAALAPSAADATARPINRIRATAIGPGEQVVGEAILDVDPNQDAWDVSVDLNLPAGPALVVVTFTLVHVEPGGAETVEFSGRAGPLLVRPGSVAEPVELVVRRGPPDNLAVTGVDVAPLPPMVEGSTRALAATVTTSQSGTPVVFWTSLTPDLLSVVGSTATALLPGTARVVAVAGPVADTADVVVTPRIAGVPITPSIQSVEGVGVEVAFGATVVDPRARPIPGQTVLWRSLDSAVLESIGGGRFRTLGAGTGRVEARSAADTTVKAVATARVTLRATDLAVTKTTDSRVVAPGDTVVFSLAVANLGGAEARGVRVRDVLPRGLAPAGTQPGSGTFDDGTGVWSVGTLAAGARATLEMRARVTAEALGTTVENQAELMPSDDQPDSDASNNRASASVTVPGNTDLALDKSAARSVLAIGDTAVFTIVVTNQGDLPAPSVLVIDSLPTGLTYLRSVGSAGLFDNATRTWTVGGIPAHGSAMLTLSAIVGPAADGQTVTNVARLSVSGVRDGNPANDRDTASVSVTSSGLQANVAVAKSVAASTGAPGDTATFTVTVSNLGPDAAPGVQVRDSLPGGLTFVSAATATGTFAPGTMIWSVGTLAAGGPAATLTVRAVVGAGTAGQTLINRATYLANGPVPDPTAGNNVATASVTVPAPNADIELFKAVDNATPSELAQVHYTVTATNLGPVAATGIRIRDVLPTASLVLDSVRTATGTVAGDSIWTIPSLAVSASAQMHIYATVRDLTGGNTVVNTATRVGLDQVDPVSANDAASRSITVARRTVDIQVRKTVSNVHPLVGTAIVYTVVAKNAGPGGATNVVVSDTLPSQLQLDSVRTTAGTFTPHLWTIASLAQGDSAILRAFMTVPGAQSGQTVTNVARRVSATQNELTPANDSSRATITVPISNPPVVGISTPSDGAVYDPGDTITFVATASDPEDGSLTASIVWRSNVGGVLGSGGSISRSNLAPGPHRVSATVTDIDGNVVADTVDLTIAIVTTPTSLNVPFGSTSSLPISLSAPAPAGGLTLTITSADTTRVRPVTPTVFIPGGALSANAQLVGVLPGSSLVTAATLGYGSSQTNVAVTAALNILQGSVTFARSYSSTFQVRLESQGVAIAAPTGGISVTLTPTDPTCVAVPSPLVIPAGQVQATATATYGSGSTAPCNSTVTATASGVGSDAFTVYVTNDPAITLYTAPVGSGLVTSSSVGLDYASHGGITVHVESGNPSVLLLSASAGTAGTAAIDVPLANGATSFTYYLHGLEGATGTVAVVGSAPGFFSDTANVVVVQPAQQIQSLATSYNSLAADQPFQVVVGIPDVYYYGYDYGTVVAQAIRPGGTPLIASVTSSDTAKARLVTTARSGDSVTVTVAIGQSTSPSNVATGGVALDFRAAGSTTVHSAIPGVIARTPSTVSVNITSPGISPSNATVGSGLQTSTGASLGSGNHGGVTVHLASTDSTLLRLAPNASTPGTGTLDVVLPNGQTYVGYYVQGMEGKTGTARVLITAPGFNADSATVGVVQPAQQINGLGTSYTSLNPDQAFYVSVGIPDVYYYGYDYGTVVGQQIRAGGIPLAATITSSDTAKARLVTTARSGDSVTVTVAVGQSNSPTSVATGGVALDFRTAGSTTVHSEVPGLIARTPSTVVVAVTSPGISPSNATVGGGLQVGLGANLGASNHGGVTVHLVSTDSTKVLLAPNASTPGSGTLDVAVANGQTYAGYYVQGVEGTTGTARVRITAPGFTADSATVSVVAPVIGIANLPTSTTTLSPNAAFYVQVGIPDVYYYGYDYGTVYTQQIRAGGSPVTATIVSDQVGVGQLQTTTGTSGTQTVQIAVQTVNSPTSVAAGGVAFDPVGTGTTNVSVTAPGFGTRPTSTVAVTVSAPSVTVSPAVVGAGLQVSTSLSLGASQHGGVTVRVRSSAPGVALVAPNASTPGTDYIDVPVANGVSSFSFYVQGVEGTTGTVTLTASAPGFTDGTATGTVVQPALMLSNLPTSISVGSADRLFYVQVGIPDVYYYGYDYGGIIAQVVRAGGVAVTATVTSGQAAVGTLVTTAGAAGSRTVGVAVGQSQSPSSVAAGGIAFDPLSTGGTTVSGTIAGYGTRPSASVAVTVTP